MSDREIDAAQEEVRRTYMEGLRACQSGVSRSLNPRDDGSVLDWAWDYGWLHCSAREGVFDWVMVNQDLLKELNEARAALAVIEGE